MDAQEGNGIIKAPSVNGLWVIIILGQVRWHIFEIYMHLYQQLLALTKGVHLPIMIERIEWLSIYGMSE